MAKQCSICGKGSIMMCTRSALFRSHRNPSGKKRKYPNLQKATVDGEKMVICTKCKKLYS
ncbi:50S ribosomal protein L28 [bacterium]|nr:MAG: 50S ribosomal protein L28 [bacterium]